MLVVAVALVFALPACVVTRQIESEPDAKGRSAVPEDLPPGVRYAGPGGEAATFLRADTERLVIEGDQAEGAEISSSSLSHLQRVLGSVADKPGGIEVQTSTITTGKSDYTQKDLRALEDQHRQTSTGGGTASMYVLALNGQFRDQRGVIGVAYSGSSYALFLRQAERGAPGVIGDSAAVERAVLVHEAGHLLALVNIGYESPRGREDPDHPNHSTHERSVMHWAVESVEIFRVLGGGPPDDFDEADRGDLADIRSGAITPEF